MANTKEQFIQTTCSLLETQGYHATGMNQIITESEAPKGSLYYHFPGGKEQLAEEAIRLSGKTTADLIRNNFSSALPLPEAVRDFILGVAHGVEVTNFHSGGPLTAVAMETANTNQRLNRVCREAFIGIQEAFAEKIEQSGVPADQAFELAAFITASIEGAIMLSRTHHSIEPLIITANHLHLYLQGVMN